MDNMEGKVKKNREKEGKWKIMVLFRHEYCFKHSTAEGTGKGSSENIHFIKHIMQKCVNVLLVADIKHFIAKEHFDFDEAIKKKMFNNI